MEFFLWKIAYCFCERLPDLLFSIQLILSIILKKNGLNIWKTIWRTSWSETEQSVARKLSYIFKPSWFLSSSVENIIFILEQSKMNFLPYATPKEIFGQVFDTRSDKLGQVFWQTGYIILFIISHLGFRRFGSDVNLEFHKHDMTIHRVVDVGDG